LLAEPNFLHPLTGSF